MNIGEASGGGGVGLNGSSLLVSSLLRQLEDDASPQWDRSNTNIMLNRMLKCGSGSNSILVVTPQAAYEE